MDAKKLDRIRRLIEMASRTGGTEDDERERQVAQAQAEALMTKYSVEEWQLAQEGGPNAKAAKPETRDKIFICATGHPCRISLASLAFNLGRHLNVAVHTNYLDSDKNYFGIDVTATAVGYPEDLSMWETIFTVLHLQLLSKIDPKIDISKTFDENVYTLHSAGIKWKDIAQRINAAATPAGWYVKWTENGDGGRLKRAARRHAELIGVPYVPKANPTAYQRSFTQAFVSTVLRRFREARENDKTSGAELVLRDKFASVKETQNELYPDLRPVIDKSNIRHSEDGWANGTEAGKNADLNLASKFGAKEKGELAK